MTSLSLLKTYSVQKYITSSHLRLIAQLSMTHSLYLRSLHSRHTVRTRSQAMESVITANFSCDIGFNRCILVQCKEGKSVIDFATVGIRDGQPCKIRNKSIRIPILVWNNFTEMLDDIEEAYTNLIISADLLFQRCLGNNIYITMTGGVLCVDMRTHYTDKNGELKPGQPGISFKLAEFQELLNIVPDIDDNITQDSQPSSRQGTPESTPSLAETEERISLSNSRPRPSLSIPRNGPEAPPTKRPK